MKKYSYLFIAIVTAVFSISVSAATPKDCSSGKSGTAKIYKDKELKTVASDMDSDSHGINPQKEHKINGQTIYEGSAYFSRNGTDVKGKFFINAAQWVCQ
jgi:hypothetical protein